MTGPITVFVARQIVTMNPSNPTGTHVAVRDGKVLGVGTLDEVAGWGPYELDETFADLVLTAGMIEVHSHTLEGLIGRFPYHGYFDRPGPGGTVLPGMRSFDDLIADLRRIDAELDDPAEPLISIGFDPIHFRGARLDRHHLDAVSTTRPIFVFHASGHLATVNTAMLERHGITRDTPAVGVAKGADGEPNGELQEPPAMTLAESGIRPLFGAVGAESTILNFGALARQAGVTCVGDLGSTVLSNPAALATWQRVTGDGSFPARVTLYPWVNAGLSRSADELALELRRIQVEESTDRLRIPGVKLVLDGSIQGWTAEMRWPGYYSGTDHGQLLVPPEQLLDLLRPFHRAGINIHLHCNGETTVGLAIDTIDQLVREWSWLDHRHTIQHSQLTTQADFRKMKNLGICANIFANHLWYWGDAHYEITVGPERAHRLEPCGTAKRIGVPFSIHSDASVTPLGPLHLIWCAVNRLTPSGRVLGEHEKISVYDAMWAVTQDAAYQMHLDHELGSVEIGKWADFTVLTDSPLDIDPMDIRDIGVWGTVVGGVKQPAG